MFINAGQDGFTVVLVEATAEQHAAFVRALSRQLEGAMTRKDFCEQVAAISGESMSVPALDHWLKNKVEPTRRKVFAAEEVLGLEPGALSRHLGYLPLSALPVVTLDQLLKQETRLRARDREAILGLYRVLIGEA